MYWGLLQQRVRDFHCTLLFISNVSVTLRVFIQVFFSQPLTLNLLAPTTVGARINLRLLMSYIYIYIYIYMEHLFLMFLDHTQRRTTVGRTPLDE